MTTVITRLYADDRAAEKAKKKLRMEGFPNAAVLVLDADIMAGDTAAARMASAMVPDALARGYNAKKQAGNALLVVRATYKPLGARRIARELLAETDAIDIGLASEEAEVADPPNTASSILKDHPRFFALLPVEIDDIEAPRFSDVLGLRLLSKRKRRNSAQANGGRRVSRAFWPMPLISGRNRRARSAQNGKPFSQKFWPRPLLSTRPRRNSVIRGGSLPFSMAMGWKTIMR